MSPLGERLGDVRRRHGYTQEQLAERSGVSVSTIRKLERGERDGARMATMHALAAALDVSTSALLEPGPPDPVRDDTPYKVDLLRFRQVLMPTDAAIPAPGATPSGAADLDRLGHTFATAKQLWEAASYGRMAVMVPDLLSETRQAVTAYDDQRSRELLAGVLQLTGQLLTQIRQYDLAYFPLVEAMSMARRQGGELTAAYIAPALCWLFTRQGRLDDAERVATETADVIEPKMSRAAPEEIGAWGRLLLCGSSAAVRNNRRDESDEMLSLAASGAGRLTRVRHHHWAAIGPFDHVTVARRRVEHAAIRGDYREALDITATITDNDAPTSLNRNRHLLDVADAHTAQRDYVTAFGVLRQVRHNAAEWLTHQIYGRDILARILDAQARPVSGDAREMADLLGLA